MTANRLAFGGVLVTVLIALVAWSLAARNDDGVEQSKPPLGLMTSLPIYWNASADIEGMLAQDEPDHWVRTQLQHNYDLVPLDTLAAEGGTAPHAELARLDRLILAQPAALPPADLAALDAWVRDGGRLLLFADPMLTEHSEFALGDRRRPQDVAMLSPILARWGLTQFFDPEQGDAERSVRFGDIIIPVELGGTFERTPTELAKCAISAAGLLADCAIAKGRALIVGDAAVLAHHPVTAGKETAFRQLVAAAFDDG